MARRSIVPLALAVATLLAAAAPAAARTLIYTDAEGGGFVSRPEKLRYSEELSQAGASLVFKRLEWRDWGDEKARGTGRLKACVKDVDCYRSEAEITAKRWRSVDRVGYYTKLRVTTGQQRFSFALPLP